MNLYGFVGNEGISRVDILGLDQLGEEIRQDWLQRLYISHLTQTPIGGAFLSRKDHYFYSDEEGYISKQPEVQVILDAFYNHKCKTGHQGTGGWEKIDVGRGNLIKLFLDPSDNKKASNFWLGSNNPHTEVVSGSFECCVTRDGTKRIFRNVRVNYEWKDLIDAKWGESFSESLVWIYERLRRGLRYRVTVAFTDER